MRTGLVVICARQIPVALVCIVGGSMRKQFIVTLLGLFAAISTHSGIVRAETPSEFGSVQMDAVVQSSPAQIKLRWKSVANTTSLAVSRRVVGTAAWGSATTLAASAAEYTDNTATLETAYEYRVTRTAAGKPGTGYLRSGIDVPAVESRGRLLLLVDSTIAGGLTADIATLIQDLKADGWTVTRIDASRSDSVVATKAKIVAAYNQDAANTKALYILGHIAVPYSGNISPDGHGDHHGAWPADAYYGDMDGAWTDTSVNSTSGSNSRNHNVPGDKKFDQSSIPSPLELEVGRVDLFDMDLFGPNESGLLKNYLVKAHDFKHKVFTPTARAIVFDHFTDVGNPLASTGYRAASALVGNANVTNANGSGTPFHQLLNGQSYLFTYACGGGGYTQASNVGTSADYASKSLGGVFNMTFGSYFGDWDTNQNFLRAAIAGGKGLTNSWAGIPNQWFHGMAMGDTAGRSIRISQNNTTEYAPKDGGWNGDSTGTTHVALMGDPSLRAFMVAPPKSLSVVQSGGTLTLSWTASNDAVKGYYIYRVNGTSGAQTRVTPNAIVGTTATIATGTNDVGSEFMVRAIKVEQTGSGRFLNASLGAFATATGSAAVPDGGTLPDASTSSSSSSSGSAGNSGDGTGASSSGSASSPGGDDDTGDKSETQDESGCTMHAHAPNGAGMFGIYVMAAALAGATARRRRR